MKITFTGLLVLSLLSFASCAQNTSDTDAAKGTSTSRSPTEPLTISLALADNTGRSRLALTLTNTGNKPLPASGWTLYFNSGSAASADANVARVAPVNGDFYSLKPGPAFKAIAPGQSATITIQDRHIRNVTDFPIGFYLVFDADPEQAFPVGLTVSKGNQFDKADQQLAERIYDQNAGIQSIPADKRTKIFPTPVSYQETGQPFLLDKQVVLVADKAFTAEADVLASLLATVVGTRPAIRAQASGKSHLAPQKSGYSPGRIRATDQSGWYYAVGFGWGGCFLRHSVAANADAAGRGKIGIGEPAGFGRYRCAPVSVPRFHDGCSPEFPAQIGSTKSAGFAGVV